MRVKIVTSKRLHNNRMQFEQNVRKVNNTVTEYDHGDNHPTRDTSLWSELKRQYRLMTITCSVTICHSPQFRFHTFFSSTEPTLLYFEMYGNRNLI